MRLLVSTEKYPTLERRNILSDIFGFLSLRAMLSPVYAAVERSISVPCASVCGWHFSYGGHMVNIFSFTMRKSHSRLVPFLSMLFAFFLLSNGCVFCIEFMASKQLVDILYSYRLVSDRAQTVRHMWLACSRPIICNLSTTNFCPKPAKQHTNCFDDKNGMQNKFPYANRISLPFRQRLAEEFCD